MAAGSSSNRWLWGPVPDLLLGCGLWYFVAFELFALYGREIRFGGGLLWAPILMMLFGVPHHGATLLRVYESRRDRRAYAFFAVWASLLVWGAFVVGVYNALVGSLVLTLFLTWSPWHYTGQNYGIAVMFLRRNGVELPSHVKRWLYASFILSYILTVVVMHHGGTGASYSAVPYDVTGYNFLSLRIPYSQTIFLVVGTAYLVTIVVSAALLLRRAAPGLLGPVAALVASQALWFSIPVALRAWNVGTGLDPIDRNPEYYFLWIGVAHAVQYLWVTSYYYKASPRWQGKTRYLIKAAAAGALVWTLPALIFAPDALGRLPFDAGLAALIAATVNLQHFILDGAIWKLRDGRVARVLIRSSGPEEAELPSASRWGPRLVWAVGAACVAVMGVDVWESYFGVRHGLRSQDVPRVERAVDRLNWIGRDNPALRLKAGALRLRRGEQADALHHFERAAELQPSAQSWSAVAEAESSAGHWERASEAYETALGFAPDDAELHHRAALVWIERDDPVRARQALERALALDPKRAEARSLLRRLEREAEPTDAHTNGHADTNPLALSRASAGR